MWKLFLILFSLNIGCTYETSEILPEDLGDEMKGWAASRVLITGAGVNAGFKGVMIQAELEYPDSLTTQFNIESSGPANCRARITSLVNGNSIVRVITVVDGATITTRGKNINVELGDFTAGGISNGVEYSVSALATLGVRAGFKQPPYLTPLEYEAIAPTPAAAAPIVAAIPIPATNGEVEVTVPENAGVTSVFVSMSSVGLADDGEYQVEQRIGSTVFQVYDPRNYDWVPLYPGTNIIRLHNVSSAEISAMVFFGIDG